MRAQFALSAIILTFVASPASAAAAAGCKLAKVAELHVTMNGLTPIVTTKIGKEPANLIVDTGAFFSLLTPRAAEKFKLRPKAMPAGLEIRGAVGGVAARLGNAEEFTFGSTTFRNVDFLIAGDSLGDADGLLGQNLLGLMDVEYDFANGVVRLFKPIDCERTNIAYWASGQSVSILPFAPTTSGEPHIIAQAKVNELPIKVVFDTGFSRSTLKLGAAIRAGATLHDEDARPDDEVRGIGRRSTDAYVLPFASFQIGSETIKNTRLRVAKTDSPSGDMYIGADFFLSHRVLISKSQNKIYFTYNGGPVFRLDDGGGAPKPAQALTPAQSAKAEGEGADVGALRRRAAASFARRDYASAIGDLDKAVAARPDDAELLYERARARLGAGEGDQARADLDRSLKLAPGAADPLLLRGYMKLQGKDFVGAEVDFAAVLKSMGEGSAAGLQVADFYAGVDRQEQALARYDAWIAANPGSFDINTALNGRCWARAMLGRDLDKALADCDRALKRGSRLANVLDSRGMVHLRRGEFAAAIADYDAALKLQPKNAWSLYGRGLAKLKRGDRTGGEVDLKAAAALQPDILQDGEQRGLTEATVVVARAS